MEEKKEEKKEETEAPKPRKRPYPMLEDLIEEQLVEAARAIHVPSPTAHFSAGGLPPKPEER